MIIMPKTKEELEASRQAGYERRARARISEEDSGDEPSITDNIVAGLVKARADAAKALGQDMSQTISPSDAESVHKVRSKQARKQDTCQKNRKKVTRPDLDWVLNPGKKDVPGIDGPGYCYVKKNGTPVCVQKKKSKFPKSCGGKKKKSHSRKK